MMTLEAAFNRLNGEADEKIDEAPRSLKEIEDSLPEIEVVTDVQLVNDNGTFRLTYTTKKLKGMFKVVE